MVNRRAGGANRRGAQPRPPFTCLSYPTRQVALDKCNHYLFSLPLSSPLLHSSLSSLTLSGVFSLITGKSNLGKTYGLYVVSGFIFGPHSAS